MNKYLHPGPFLRRKFVHIICGALFIVLGWWMYNEYNRETVLMVFGVLLLLNVIQEFLRIEFLGSSWVPFQVKKEENRHFSSFTYAVSAGLIVIALFDGAIAFAAISIAIFGDAAAAIVGRTWGKRKLKHNRTKTREGFWAYVVFGALGGYYFLPFVYVFIMALIGAFIESACKHVEDNFLVPYAIAFVAYGLMFVL